MKLLFKQRFFSWLDSYDVYDEAGNTVFTVEGKLSWGHRLHILDADRVHVGTLQEAAFAFLPRFDIYEGKQRVGSIRKEFTFFKPRFTLEPDGWTVEGSVMEWDYSILTAEGYEAARVCKELFHWTDTYVLDIAQPQDALRVLLIVLAIDAEKCSRGDN